MPGFDIDLPNAISVHADQNIHKCHQLLHMDGWLAFYGILSM